MRRRKQARSGGPIIKAYQHMDSRLEAFLAPLIPFAEEMKHWHGAPLRLSCYLTDATPPRQYVSSARAIVVKGDQVLLVQDQVGTHITPGGRLEPDETPEIALRREVLEETGWSLSTVRPIGVLHFAHTRAAPENWPHPYPDFLQVVYASSPNEYCSELKQEDEYVLGSEFVSIETVRQMPLDSGQHAFLAAAI